MWFFWMVFNRCVCVVVWQQTTKHLQHTYATRTYTLCEIGVLVIFVERCGHRGGVNKHSSNAKHQETHTAACRTAANKFKRTPAVCCPRCVLSSLRSTLSTIIVCSTPIWITISCFIVLAGRAGWAHHVRCSICIQSLCCGHYRCFWSGIVLMTGSYLGLARQRRKNSEARCLETRRPTPVRKCDDTYASHDAIVCFCMCAVLPESMCQKHTPNIRFVREYEHVCMHIMHTSRNMESLTHS